MEKSGELIVIRYIGLIIMLIQIVTLKNDILGLIIGLVIILNNNLRLYFFKEDKVKLIAIILNIIFAFVGWRYLNGIILFYLIGEVIDSFTFKEKGVRYGILGTIFLLEIFQSAAEKEKIVYIGVLIILVVLFTYINKLYMTKIEAQKLYDKLRISEKQLKEANKELENYALSIEELTLLKERNRISREIHDSVGHALSTSMIQLAAMEAIATKEESSLKDMAKSLREFINESFQDVKKAVREIKPKGYSEYSGVLKIQDICKNFEKMTGISVNVTISKEVWNIDSSRISHLYRITQEVLSNSLRHGKATVINVIINFSKDEMTISFKDNGIGGEVIKETGVGLKSIKERAKEMGGTVYMSTKTNEGFFVKINILKEVKSFE